MKGKNGDGGRLIEHDATKAARKRTKGGALVDVRALEASLQRDLADQTKALVKAEPLGAAATIIRTKNRRFTIGEQPLEAPIRCVILATAAAQFYYEDEYDPNVKSSPACFALAPTEGELAPDARAPDRQHDGPCVTCPQNQPGSGRRGGFSRACQLRRRLAILMVDDRSDDPAWASLELSVTAIKGWSNYVRGLAGVHNLAYFAAVTELDFEDDKSGDYWHLSMRFVDRLSNVRPDWLTPAKGVKVGAPGWFDTTVIGRKVREITDGKALLQPPLAGTADAPARGQGGRRRVKVQKKAGRRPEPARAQGQRRA